MSGTSVLRPRRCVLPVVAALVLLSVAGCRGNGGVIGVPEPPAQPADARIRQGRALIGSFGCGACHLVPGVPGADSMAGPPLERFWERSVIAGRLANTEDNLVRWIRDPQGIEPGNAMPNLGVGEEEARAMAAYLYHQPTVVDRLFP